MPGTTPVQGKRAVDSSNLIVDCVENKNVDSDLLTNTNFEKRQ